MRPGKEPQGAPRTVQKDQAARKARIKEKARATPDEAAIVEEHCRRAQKLAAVAMQATLRKNTAGQEYRRLKNSPDV